MLVPSLADSVETKRSDKLKAPGDKHFYCSAFDVKGLIPLPSQAPPLVRSHYQKDKASKNMQTEFGISYMDEAIAAFGR
jgi:hypothetical protein